MKIFFLAENYVLSNFTPIFKVLTDMIIFEKSSFLRLSNINLSLKVNEGGTKLNFIHSKSDGGFSTNLNDSIVNSDMLLFSPRS
jgi:hypothetical protein